MYYYRQSPIRCQPINFPQPIQYQFISELGSGAYSKVNKVFDNKTQQYLAMKIISKRMIQQYKAQENIKREIDLLQKLNSKYILKIKDIFEDQQNMCIILEYCNGGTLMDLINKRKKLCEKEAFIYFYQICLAIDYLHKNNIAHRDIKPENILLHDQNIKICDFNWAIELKEFEQAEPVICGTTEYMPPEVVMKVKHDKSTDIWSLGIILYYLLHGDIPFKGLTQQEKIQNILTTTFELDQSLSIQAQILIHQMLCRTACTRIKIAEIFQTNWMKQFMNQLDFRNPYPNLKLQVKNLKSRHINSLKIIIYYQYSCSSQQTSNTVQSCENKLDSKQKRSFSKPMKSVPLRAINISAFRQTSRDKVTLAGQSLQNFFPQNYDTNIKN